MYQYQVSFGTAISRALSKYCCFTGRSSRSELWWWVLFTMIISIAIGICQGIFIVLTGKMSTMSYLFDFLEWAWSLAIFLPSLGLEFRRLHDTGRSGWNICWSFLPIIGGIILLVYFCQDSQMETNEYGEVPNLAKL